MFALLIAGYALQISFGNINFHLYRWPVNGFLGGLLLFIILALGILFQKNHIVRWFSGVHFAVSLMSALLVHTIIMGLTPQISSLSVHVSLVSNLGLNQMTSSWPFVLLYVTLLLSLGTLSVRRMIPFQLNQYAFYLNHWGLWLVLFTTGLGAADLKRYVMYVQVKDENPEWRVYNEKEEMLELPIALYLDEFILEQYDPKLTIIDKQTGEILPRKLPEFIQLDRPSASVNILEWQVDVLKYLPQAVPALDGTYQELPMPGSAPAARVKITQIATGKTDSAWISCGSFAQLYSKYDLDSRHSLAMTLPEPKRFASKVILYSKYEEKTDTALIEVNKPLSHHGWMIYQYSYDENAGKASAYSSFELVYDPWKNFVYLSFILVALGSIALFQQRKTRKENVK